MGKNCKSLQIISGLKYVLAGGIVLTLHRKCSCTL